MALIKTQKALRQAINVAKKELTDRNIFFSESYYDFLNAMIAGITKRFEQPIKIELAEEGENDPIFTDGNMIHINIGSKPIKESSRREKHKSIIASVLHECGHILFTDFILNEITIKKLNTDNVLYPQPKDSDLKEHVTMWMLQHNAGSMLIPLYHRLDNCIEDGHIDARIIKHIPGYGECRTWYKKERLASEMPTFESMKANPNMDNISIMLNMILSYAKFDILLYNKSSSEDPLIKKFFDIKIMIDEAILENNSVERKRMVNDIFIHIFSLIEEEIKKQNTSQQSTSGNDASVNASDAPKNVQNKKGDANDSANKTGSTNGSDANSDSKNSKDTNSKNKNKDTGSHSPLDPAFLQQTLSQSMNCTASALSEKDNVHKNTERLKVINEDKNKTNVQNVSNNSKEKHDQDNGLELIENNVAKEQVSKEQEKELQKSLSSELKEISKHQMHKNVYSNMVRQNVTSVGRMRYEECHILLDCIAKRLTKNLEREIKERKIGDTLNGLYSGKRLDSKGLYRQDMKIFTKKIQPENIPDMEVFLLVDLSRSMNGDRTKTARETAYIMYRFCKQLNIPVSIYGHHVTGGTVEVRSYTDRISLDNKDEIRIFEMDASGCNRDGYALRFCLNKLKKSDAVTKLMFVVSDGRPNDHGYHLEEGKKDIQDAVSDARKNGIITVTAAIGTDTDSVKYIYTEGISEKRSAIFLDITELDKLPQTFPKVIKRYLY